MSDNASQNDDGKNLYINFEHFADGAPHSYKGCVISLRDQLKMLRKIHKGSFFASLPDGADLLTEFMKAFFPDRLTREYFISNISLGNECIYLMIRPGQILPRQENLLPAGKSMAICARVLQGRNNATLDVRKILVISESEIKPFEFSLKATVITDPNVLDFPIKRTGNVMTQDLLGSFPLISKINKQKTEEWAHFLDWKRKLIASNMSGIKYIDFEITKNGLMKFLTVSEGEEDFADVKRIFKSNDIAAFPVDYSTDSWSFVYNEKNRTRPSYVGDLVSVQPTDVADCSITGNIPWHNPYFAHVIFKLAEEAQDIFDQLIEIGADINEVIETLKLKTNKNGFLANSIIGDMALIKRQQKELNLLIKESGHSPYLTSYLFDITQANLPEKIEEIEDKDWFHQNLNNDQKNAVQKMLNSPDIALIQGPPGTGKTTMIAEATLQFVRKNKKVLLVSQANLAVDNALERLGNCSEIRAIRLGNKGEESNPFSKQNAIKTYYASIAKKCTKSILEPWKKRENEIIFINKWNSDLRIVENDIIEAQKRIGSLQKELSENEKELQKLAEIEAVNKKNETLKDGLTKFKELLKTGQKCFYCIPESHLDSFYKEVVCHLNNLAETGIIINQFWCTKNQNTIGERTNFAAEIINEWSHFKQQRPQLEADLTRLKLSDNYKILSTEKSLELSELERKLALIQEEMKTDASKVELWQKTHSRITQIRRSGSGLDKCLYAKYFKKEIEGRPAYLLFTAADSDRITVVKKLTESLNKAKETEKLIALGLEKVSREIDQHIASIACEQTEPAKINQLEGKNRFLTVRLKEESENIKNKNDRALEIMNRLCNEFSISMPLNNPFSNLKTIAASIVKKAQETLAKTEDIRNDWQGIIEEWVTDLKNEETIKNDEGYLLETYISACNVAGATCTEKRSSLENAGHSHFDVTIIDEVSKATPTEIVMPMMMSRTSILVGDHRQLPPLFKEGNLSFNEVLEEVVESEKNIHTELTRENMERYRKMVTASLFKEHFENADERLKSYLLTQYRMHPQIMNVVNQFYDNLLKCGLPDPDGKMENSDSSGHRIHNLSITGPQKIEYLAPDRHVLWLDSSYDPQRKKVFEEKSGNSKINDLEAAMIARVVIDLEISCRKQGYGSQNKEAKRVGIITFYGRQVRRIREAIRKLIKIERIEIKAVKYDVNTVDRYQGQERPIVIVSMVRSPEGSYLSQRANTAQYERINVAYSRAQELLVILGAKDVFCRYPVRLPDINGKGSRKVDSYRIIIDEIQRLGGYWNSEAIITQQQFEALKAENTYKNKNGEKNKWKSKS